MASDDWAQAEAETGHGRPDSDRAGPGLSGVRLAQDGQRQRRHDGTPHTLKRPCGDELQSRCGQRARDRSKREHDHAGRKEAFAPEAVSEAAAERNQDGQAEGIGADDPFELAG